MPLKHKGGVLVVGYIAKKPEYSTAASVKARKWKSCSFPKALRINSALWLAKDAPYTRPIERFGHVVTRPILGGLHHRYARI